MRILTGQPLPPDLLATEPWSGFAYHHPADLTPELLAQASVYVDTDLDRHPVRAALLRHLPESVIALVGSVGSSLFQLTAGHTIRAKLYGFCALPYFLQRDTWEISQLRTEQDAATDLAWLGRPYVLVPDQPGLVAPRVVARIINEAYFALGEGVAAAADIDLAVRLGVNYPLGPLHWGQQIGLSSVVAILEALQGWGGSEAYQVAPALRRAAVAATAPAP